MMRITASLVLAFAIALSGCKKDTPKEEPDKPAAVASITVPSKLPSGVHDAPAECKRLCMIVGKCAIKDGKCFANSNAACEASVGCRTVGHCGVKDELCLATQDKHCEDSQTCATHGKCVAVDGRCDNKNIVPAGSAKPAASK